MPGITGAGALMQGVRRKAMTPEFGERVCLQGRWKISGLHLPGEVLEWDGEGFKDAAARHSGIYASYKLVLYLIAAERLNISAPHRDEVIDRLLAMQSTDGGWKTDYKDGKPVGLANVETTCLSLLALQTLIK